MRFGLEEDGNGEKVAKMTLDNGQFGQINKYNILIGNVSTMDMDIDKSTFYQSVDIAVPFFNANSLKASRINVNNKLVITNTSPSLYLKDTDGRSGMINMAVNRMYFLSGVANSESWAPVNSQYPLCLQTDTNEAVFGAQVNCHTDCFHYSAGAQRYDVGTNSDVPWTSTRRGSVIRNGDSFRPAFSGLYSITVHLFCGSNSTGQLRVGLKLNNVVLDLNSGSGLTYIVTANAGNVDVDSNSGTIIVNAVAGQDIKAYVHTGT